MTPPAVRRSWLVVPGSSPRMLGKAADGDADELVLDLEDAVAPAAKDEARDIVCSLLADPRWERPVAVRINAVGTPWAHRDLTALAGLAGRPLSIVVPKVESGSDLVLVARLLDEAEAGRRRHPLRIQALIETAAGVARINEIAASCERLEALILGYADLAASLGRSRKGAQDPETWRPLQETLLVAARANGLEAIDGPYLGLEPDDRFRAAVSRARDLGFDGKWAIHPSQLSTLNELFLPSLARAGDAVEE